MLHSVGGGGMNCKNIKGDGDMQCEKIVNIITDNNKTYRLCSG